MDLAGDDLNLLFNGIQASRSVDSQDIFEKKTSDGNKHETDVRCPICDTSFSNNGRYQSHLGTKKHKRNARTLRRETLEKENSQIIGLADGFENRYSYKGVREKYQRNIRNYESNYTSYLWSVVAYWASSLVVNPTVRDFKISLNNKKWGAFGDAVVEIEFIDFPEKPSVTKTFAVQFKYIISNNFRNIASFSDKSFNFVDVISKLTTVKAEKDSDDVKFIVYSTATVSPDLNSYQPLPVAFCSSCFKLKNMCVCLSKNQLKDVPVFAKPLSSRARNIIDTSDGTQSIYYFFSSESKFVLPKIYFHMSQKTPRYFPESINTIFLEVLNERSVQVSRELIKYVENWNQGRCGGTYKLKKEDFLVKLGQLFLSRFVVIPKVKPMDPHNNFDLWVQATESAQVTVLRDSVNLSDICEPINLLIEKELGLKIDVANETVQFLRTSEGDNIDKITNPILRDYIFEESHRNFKNDLGAIPMEKVYLAFWKAGLVPLMLNVNNLKDQEYVLHVINFLKGFGLNRRYFLKTSDPNIKTLVRSFKNVSFFLTLDDVADKLDPRVWDQVKINVTERFSVNLNAIRETDKFFQKSVSATEFFDMALGRYVFKPVGYRLTQGRGEDLKLILSNTHMQILRHEVESKIDSRFVSRTESVPQDVKWLRGLNPNLFG